MDEMGGLLRKLPFIGAALVMAMMAGCGLPGFGNFVGEMLVLFGGWQSDLVICGGWISMRWFVAAAAWGAMVVAAVYMLRAIRTMSTNPHRPHRAGGAGHRGERGSIDATAPIGRAPWSLIRGKSDEPFATRT
jgi:NADH:ubiquinone oxidoreductase subunit 4 (subunit M)